MKKVLLGTLAVLTLAACSKDEVIQQNPNDEISFSVTTNKAISRAANGFCNNHTPKRFVVSASYTKGGSTTQYFLNDRFIKNGSAENGKEYNAFKTYRYWPDLTGGASMTFYAATDGTKETVEDSWDTEPVSVLPSWTKDGSDNLTGMKILNYKVEDAVADQKDLLYAVQEANPTGGVQNINFRHALSQIEFAAINENTKIHVEICGVSIVNVKNKGDFTFPASTSDKIGVHNGNAGYPDPATDKVGTWDVSSDAAAIKTYATNTLTPNAVVKVGASSTPLTITDPSEQEWNTNTMYLIPQTLTPWDRSGNAVDKSEKSYFLVKAKIWNIAGASFDKDNDVLLWGTGASESAEGAKDIAIPTDAADWKPGKRYVYTFKFTKTGEGGANPDDNTDVLVPIKLTVTVDDFVDGGTVPDIEMKKP